MLIFYFTTISTAEERKTLTYLYDKFKGRLFHTALKITNNQVMAEDAVHNTFISAIHHKEKIISMDEIDFLRWSVIVVKGKCIDLIRKEKHYADSSIDEFDDILPSNTMPVDEYVIQQDTYRKLKNCIDGLDEVSSQILEMKYILHMPMKEIADELGFTLTQVNSHITRARTKVRNLMGNEVLEYA
ncbi:MAG: sigma-70 family RNA polymerase sigma factor [Oscillospiraceae bacterium]|nr:sigma-70 family RNA polymerase sigma factor [Oscillospiraceae bacterium]